MKRYNFIIKMMEWERNNAIKEAEEHCTCQEPSLQKDTKQCSKCKLFIDRTSHIIITNKDD